jgi:hypothetical protein
MAEKLIELNQRLGAGDEVSAGLAGRQLPKK